MYMTEKMETRHNFHNTFPYPFIAIMSVFRKIQNLVRRLMRNQHICVFRNCTNVPVITAVCQIFHEHRHAVQLHTVDNHRRVAQIMHIVRKSCNLSITEARVVIAGNEHLVSVRQRRKPPYEILRFIHRTAEAQVARMHYNIGIGQVSQLSMQAVSVGHV